MLVELAVAVCTVHGVRPKTKALWEKQNLHPGDRWRLFSAVSSVVTAERVLYPGSYVDVALSFVFPTVTYVDLDARAKAFFSDVAGVNEIIATHTGAPRDPQFRFIHGDYTADLGIAGDYELLVSLYAGFVSEHCTRNLQVGGMLLANPSHGDVAMASIDPRYELAGVVTSVSGNYRVRTEGLDGYLIPKAPVDLSPEMLHERGRGVAYTKSPYAYLFRRVQ